jgi:YHS domain-containing protein
VLLERHALFDLSGTRQRFAPACHPISETNPSPEFLMTDRVEIDPVCGMEVDPASAAGYSEYEDKIYYFCSNECKRRFELGPTEYSDVA